MPVILFLRRGTPQRGGCDYDALLQRRSGFVRSDKNVWGLPGGGLNKQERGLLRQGNEQRVNCAAALRETWEECGGGFPWHSCTLTLHRRRVCGSLPPGLCMDTLVPVSDHLFLYLLDEEGADGTPQGGKSSDTSWAQLWCPRAMPRYRGEIDESYGTYGHAWVPLARLWEAEEDPQFPLMGWLRQQAQRLQSGILAAADCVRCSQGLRRAAHGFWTEDQESCAQKMAALKRIAQRRMTAKDGSWEDDAHIDALLEKLQIKEHGNTPSKDKMTAKDGSWEDDAHIDALLEKLQIKEHGNTPSKDKTEQVNCLWEPSPADLIAAPHINSAWKVAYTGHPGRFESHALPSLPDLLRGPDGNSVQTALLTSFFPFDPAFLRNFPKGIELTICIQSDENKKVPKNFFGQKLTDAKYHPEHSVHTACSSLCTRCTPEGVPQRCRQDQIVPKCACPRQDLNQVKWIFPILQENDIMHCKLMLLRFEGCVRLVVSSFNFSAKQWENAGDSFWWVDLPLMPSASDNVDFRVQCPLTDILNRLHVESSWLTLLSFCDWSVLQQAKSSVHLITSVPRTISDSVTYGMSRLQQVLRSLPKFPSSAHCPAYVQVWSLGGASDRWYTDLALTLTQEKCQDLGLIAEWKQDHVKFIFQRRGGGPNWRDMGEEDLKAENRARAAFNLEEKRPNSSEVKKVMWDEVASDLLSAQDGVPPVSWGWHSKVMTREYPQGFCKRLGCTRTHGWRYMGSHNCSRASWGGKYYDPAEQACRMDPPKNWEMGVILTSCPAPCSESECGPDLADVAPLPFKPNKLARSFPLR